MSGDLVIPADTLARQRRAADPRASAWVSANAGAGKTRVLTDRVIRLLLEGAEPSRILCLTFTKAAAAEMTIRVFERLGSWVTLDEVSLRDELEKMTGARPDRATLARARRLFARAVETPGGLKIETIHAFCERILHLVPFEANVPARFAVLDEPQTAELLAAARARVLSEAATGGPLGEALEIAGAICTGDALTGLIDCAVLDERVPGDPDERQMALSALWAALGVPAGLASREVERAMLEDGIPASELPALAAELRRTGSRTDAAQAAALEAAASAAPADQRLAAYRSVFFIDGGKGTPKRSLATKAVDPGVCAALAKEQERLVALGEMLKAVQTVERTQALYLLAGAVRRAAEAAKRRLGALDFADLIRKTLELLDRGSAAWVLYKLDRGIDHVLVDEAQDTNPDQWRILRRLTEEFTAGAGRPTSKPRTVFAVGDPKQSIYSFQGADPRWFEEGRRHWKRLTEAASLDFADVRLDLSFRSAPAILKAVDHTFRVAAHFRGLSFEDAAVGTSHASARPNAPGQVEIWPTEVRKEGTEDPDAWSEPLDEPEKDAPPVVVASRIAKAIQCWTRPGNATGRVWRPKDILVLVRSRGPAFFAVIRALKAAGVPVAGADRFDMGEHIAVNDLVAAGQAALLPRNDLVLAAALKSPLVGLDDDDLVRIAADRGEAEPLVEALERAAKDGDMRAEAACRALARWRELAREHGPFGFYAALLGPGEGRRRLVERLGGEAADAIDSFLIYAQTSEIGTDTPSLSTFLARFESAAHEVKRDLDASGDEVKVMTVHGAKGLEAPLVVVIDNCDVFGREPPLVPVQAGNGQPLPVWSPKKDWDCRVVAEARERAKHLRLEEHNRLLYVAMTRARDRLVIAPFAAGRSEPEEAWCAMVRRGFAEATHALVRTETPYGEVDLWADGTHPAEPARGASVAADAGSLPDWLLAPAEPEDEPARRLRPSAALPDGAGRRRRAPDGLSRAEARRRGTLVHALIDHLAAQPPERRAEAAAAFVGARAAGLPSSARDRIVADALAVVAHPALAPLFGPGAQGEAPVAGEVTGPDGRSRVVVGQVDRMAVAADEVVVADFKTGAESGDDALPEGYLAQLALYRAVLARAYPGRRIRPVLVWTDGPEIVEPDSAMLDAALHRALAGSA
ncbi:double-strand break repair helicase AddA [Enterovirga aerilata]|uniref:DNA 3'-5' helicase n=1 Tax=Enterovirga aerilata TaxID=2730920 RepID=A0A849I1G7_9HYPH|nr:double-strand break repair helicase AddA [Enterovirga sp. DB1703]NNM71211.1 double-strand break repair helicase AddA [Enterovirga sp. DB1703]